MQAASTVEDTSEFITVLSKVKCQHQLRYLHDCTTSLHIYTAYNRDLSLSLHGIVQNRPNRRQA
jgi:hypothetical protein